MMFCFVTAYKSVSSLHQHKPPLEVNDLFEDIKDGVKLLALLEVLSGQRLVSNVLESLSKRFFNIGTDSFNILKSLFVPNGLHKIIIPFYMMLTSKITNAGMLPPFLVNLVSLDKSVVHIHIECGSLHINYRPIT